MDSEATYGVFKTISTYGGSKPYGFDEETILRDALDLIRAGKF